MRRRRPALTSLLALGLLLTLPAVVLAQPSDAYRNAALAAAKGDAKTALDAGSLPLDQVFELAAQGIFGQANLDRPISYMDLKKGLAASGLGVAELEHLVGDLPAADRDRLLAGEMTPRQIFAREASRRMSWRASTKPIAYDRLRKLLSRDGQLSKLDATLKDASAAERTAIEKGEVSPARVLELMKTHDRTHPDVVIVGAGMAGLRAARKLELAGKTVVVLEAGAKTGGRVSTDAEAFDEGPLDLGGAWIHNFFENATAAFAKALGLTLVRDVPTNHLTFDGHDLAPVDMKGIDDFIERATRAAEAARAAGKDVSIAEAMFGDPADPFNERLLASSHHGVTDTEHLSASDFLEMTEEAEDRLVAEGMGVMPEALSWGVPIETSTSVEKIESTPTGVKVHAGGVTYDAKRVIVTTSPAVLASGAIEFSPALPDWKKDAIDHLPMGKFGKVVLEFSGDVLSRVEAGTRIYDTTWPGGVVEYVVRPFGRNTVVALLGGDLADAIEKMGRDEAVAQTRDRLAKIFGEGVKTHMTSGEITTWSSNPLTRGAFSAAEPGHFDAREKLALPLGDIFFAGEATAPYKWTATIAGAWLSGDRAGDEALASLDGPTKTVSSGTTTVVKLNGADLARERGVTRTASETNGILGSVNERLDERVKEHAGARESVGVGR